MAEARKRPKFGDRIAYLLFRCVVLFFRVLPLPLSVGVGRLIAAMWWRIDQKHSQRVTDQILMAYCGELSRERAHEIMKGMYRHFGTCLAEVVRIPFMKKEELETLIDWNGYDKTFDSLLAEGKGIIFATGHLGNWELCGSAFFMRGWSAGAVARPLNNPLIDEYVRNIREACGQSIWDKRGVYRTMFRVLKENKGFGILVDQDGGKHGEFIPFFGKMASTLPTTADLAIRTGAPVVVACFHRTDKPMRFRLWVSSIRHATPGADPVEEKKWLLTLLNQDLEAAIRQAPEQWVWIQKRWKTRPPEEAESESSVPTTQQPATGRVAQAIKPRTRNPENDPAAEAKNAASSELEEFYGGK